MNTLANLIPATIPGTAPGGDESEHEPRRHLGELLGIPRGKGRSAVRNGEAEPHVFPLAKVVVRASIVADCAVTELEEHYTNTLAKAMDVTHTIPLPPDGAVTAFEIVSGSRVAKGVCKKAEEARSDFESAKKRGKTAAIIESVRDDVHTISLANVPAKSDIVVRMRIVERLRVDDGRFEYRFPTAISPKFVPGEAEGHAGEGTSPDTDRAPDASRLTPPIRLGGGTALELELTVAAGATDLAASLPLVRSSGADGAIVLRPDAAATCSGDIVLRAWSRTAEPVVRAYTDGEHTLVVVDPPAMRRPELECPREAVFVIDRSGSMDGERLVAAKRALRTALEGLSEHDTFEIIAFDNSFDTFDAEPVAATRANIERAMRWLDAVHAQGGTEALPALERACVGQIGKGRIAKGRVRTVLFLTDGDVANDGELFALSRRFDPAMRLYTVGIGMAPSAGLLSRLARLGGGTALFVDDSQDIEREIRRFESTFVGPMACGLGLAGARRHSGRDLFAGRSATFFIEGSPSTVEVTSVDGRFSGTASVSRAPIALGALWARDRVTELEDRLIADPSQKGLIDPEIAELGVRHQIQTRLTSFVAVDEESQVHGEPLAIVQPTDAPEDAGCFPAYRMPAPAIYAAAPDALHELAPEHDAAPPRRASRASWAQRVVRSVSSAIDCGTPSWGKAAKYYSSLRFAKSVSDKHDPSQQMTLRIALLTMLAWVGTAKQSKPAHLQSALDFLAAEADRHRASDPSRAATIDRLLATASIKDPLSAVECAVDCVLAIAGVRKVVDI
jgi:Ca-activated chloride channel family protein